MPIAQPRPAPPNGRVAPAGTCESVQPRRQRQGIAQRAVGDPPAAGRRRLALGVGLVVAIAPAAAGGDGESRNDSAYDSASPRPGRLSSPSLATTVTILSQKGGTGKTTTTRTLTDIFRRVGLSVLAVDLDPQGNLSDYFDVPPTPRPTMADVLTGQAKAMDAIHDDVLPANLGLAEAELVLGGKMGREMTLRRALREPGKHYDLILVDCPPSLGLLTVNALVAADRALITSEAEYFSLQGVEQALEVVELAKDSLNPDLEWLGRGAEHRRHAPGALARGAQAAAGALRREGVRRRHPPLGGVRRVGRARASRSSTAGPTWRPTTWTWPRRR